MNKRWSVVRYFPPINLSRQVQALLNKYLGSRGHIKGINRMLSVFFRNYKFSFLLQILLFTGTSQALASGSVTISSPADGASVTSPVTVAASVSATESIALMQVYFDGVKKYEVAAKSFSK